MVIIANSIPSIAVSMSKLPKYLFAGLLLALVSSVEFVSAQRGGVVPVLPPSDCDTCWAARDSSVADSLRRYSREALADSLARLQVRHDALAAEAGQLQREIAEAEQGLKKESAACNEMIRTMSPLALLHVSAVDSLLTLPFSELDPTLLRQVMAVGSRVTSLSACAVKARTLLPLKEYIKEGERMKGKKLSRAVYNTWHNNVQKSLDRFKKDYLSKVVGAVPLNEKQKKELSDLDETLWKLAQ